MITCGKAVNLADLSPIELVPALDAQEYVHPIANMLADTNQASAFLVHDEQQTPLTILWLMEKMLLLTTALLKVPACFPLSIDTCGSRECRSYLVGE